VEWTIMALTVGEVFRHYFVLAKIGSGSMCEVNLAYDMRDHVFAALKTLHDHHATVPTFVKRMQREAECYRNLEHKNIVGYQGSDFEEQPPFVAMEFLRGEPLTNRLRNEGGSLFLHDAIRVLEDIAEALHFAHKAGVVHRDIRPDNIMVDPDGNAKLCDFGIAYAQDQMLQTRMGDIKLMGLYASPEQVTGLKLDERSDLYSLGIVFYEMLSGKKLHLANNLEMFLQLFKKAAPPPSRHDEMIPESVDKIALKLLEDDPGHRYQSARELLVDTGNLRLSKDPQELERLFGKEADLLFEQAKRTYEDGDYKKTVQICQQIEEKDVHRKASLYLLLAKAAEKMRRPDISIRYLEKAAFLKSKDFTYSLEYFGELMKRKDTARAGEILKRTYPRRLDQDVTNNLKQMLALWQEPEMVELRKKPNDKPGGIFDKMKSIFSG
jgi:serine/threonine protein kinase